MITKKNKRLGIIYCIRHKELKDSVIYIGSTILKLNIRLKFHRRDCRKRKRSKSLLYNTVKFYGGWDSFECEVLESVEFIDSYELRLKEFFYIKCYPHCLNMKKNLW